MLGNNSIIISIGEEHNFFENHPNHATRMSYKMSLEGNKLGKFSKKNRRLVVDNWSIVFNS